MEVRDLLLYRARFPGLEGALCGAPLVRVDLRGACVELAAETVLLDQTLGAVVSHELAHRVADLLDHLGDAVSAAL